MGIANIALRNLSRQKRRSFLLAGAIAFGIMIITGVNGLVGGILRNTENNFAMMLSAHVMAINYQFTDKNRLIYVIQDEKPYKDAAETVNKTYKIKYQQKRTSVFNNATLIFGSDSAWRQVDGVDWGHDKFLAENIELISGSVIGMKGSNGIIIGEKTAKKLNVKLGETLLVQAETIYGQQNVIEAAVRAVYKEDGLSGGTCYMDQDAVNKLLDMPAGSFNWYGLMLENYSQLDAATALYTKTLADEKLAMLDRDKVAGKNFQTIFSDIRKAKDKGSKSMVVNLNDMLSSIKGIFDTIKLVSLFVLILLMAVIMVGLNNTYKIIVWERTREIGTMRALGMQRPQVSRIFLFEALFLSLFGVAMGMVASTVLLTIISLFDFGAAGSGDFGIFLYKSHLSWNYDLVQLVVTTVLVALLTLWAANSPAKRASRIEPAVALRTQA